MKDSALINSALTAADAWPAGDRPQILPWLDDLARTRLVNALSDRASRGASGWTPPSPSAKLVSEVQAFAAAAIRTGHAEADEVDDFLRHVMHAFLGKDYPAVWVPEILAHQFRKFWQRFDDDAIVVAGCRELR